MSDMEGRGGFDPNDHREAGRGGFDPKDLSEFNKAEAESKTSLREIEDHIITAVKLLEETERELLEVRAYNKQLIEMGEKPVPEESLSGFIEEIKKNIEHMTDLKQRFKDFLVQYYQTDEKLFNFQRNEETESE